MKKELLLDYIADRASQETKQIVEQWMRLDPENEKEVLQLASIYYAMDTLENIQARDYRQAFAEVRRRIKGKIRRIWLRRACAVAACVVGVIGLSVLFSHLMVHDSTVAPQLVTVRSIPGMRTQFNLPDGTVVHLNAGSELSYLLPFEKHERNVTLAGEAYFDVAHEPDRPFLVSTMHDRMAIQVHGTSFNVEAWDIDGRAAVTLFDGKVDVLLGKRDESPVRRTLAPSDKIVYYPERGSYRVMQVDTAIEAAWMTGKVIFKNTPLPEVLRELSHFYDVEFEVKDKLMETWAFTGTFDNRQLTHVLDYLRISSRIGYTMTHGDGVRQRKITLHNIK